MHLPNCEKSFLETFTRNQILISEEQLCMSNMDYYIWYWVHCKEPIPKIGNKYSQNRNWMARVPIGTFIWLWAIYILSPSIRLFCCCKYVDRSWEYINLSQTQECGNWDWAVQFPEKEYTNGIFVAVQAQINSEPHPWKTRLILGILTIFIPCTAPYSALSATSLYTLLVFFLTVEETEALPICGV